jgi:hypothetical protein
MPREVPSIVSEKLKVELSNSSELFAGKPESTTLTLNVSPGETPARLDVGESEIVGTACAADTRRHNMACEQTIFPNIVSPVDELLSCP